MPELPRIHPFPPAGAIVTALAGFFLGAVSMAFNPFLAVSVLAFSFAWMTLRSAARLSSPVTQGLLRILAVIGIMGGLGGAAALLFPTLGVTSI